jgi:hypothetical protein
MRFPKHLSLCCVIACARLAHAADPSPAGNPDPLPSFLTTPATPPAADPDKSLPFGDPLPRAGTTPSLLPDEIPSGTKRPSKKNPPAGGKPGAMLKPQATGGDLDMRIRYRKARNAAETNEQVRAAWQDSREAKTDYEKRQALKRYYELLFARMLGSDRGIAKLVEARHKAEIAGLTQVRIAPTVAPE